MPLPLKVLIVEDSAEDADLLVSAIIQAGYVPDWRRVTDGAAFLRELERLPDVVLSDYRIPGFGALPALDLLNRSGRDIPFIIVSGTIGEETAVEALKMGASDYLLKDRLGRLGTAIHQALERSRTHRERKAAERVLRETEGRLTLFSENSPAVIFMKDKGGRYLLVNRLFEQRFGLSRAAVLGRTDAEIFPLAQALKFQSSDRRVIQSETLLQFEEQAQTVDGPCFSIVSKFPIRDAEGRFAGICGIATDITDRKRIEEALRESEALFRQVVENIREVFWVTTPDKDKILYVSPGFEAIWGRSCDSLYRDPLLWMKCIHPEDQERVLRSAMTRQASGNFDETYRISRPDGAIRWIRDRAFPVSDKAGQIHRIVGTAEDVTDYRQLEEQLRQTQKMEAIGTLAGGLAHDFNNILTAIGGYTELARLRVTENSEAHEYLGSVLQATSRAAHLVRQMLAFSRQQPQLRQAVRLRPVVEETLQLLRATIPSTIEFDVSLAADAPVVLADTTQIHQVLMNLGTNAWHAMKDHPGRLQVKLERCVVDEAMATRQKPLPPGTYAHLTVSDTGIGMDEATQRRVFEPFFTTKPRGEGTGLGLAVVHGIMESHDGAITVHSQPGAGTAFHLYFPACAGELTGASVEAEPTPHGHGERLLFVDDEEYLAKLGQEALTALGYKVEIATQPADAFALIQADPQRFALVLTDLTMPKMNGLQLANLLVKIRPGLPIILMTGHSATLAAERAQAAGLCQILLKPITLHSLGTSVRLALA